MQTAPITPGKTYSVHTMKGCTIIAPDGWQKTIEAPDGYFDAHFDSVVIDGDDEASIKELFKLAPYQKLRLLGVVGGDQLPAGYTRLAYLESSGTQYIDTGFFSRDFLDITIKTSIAPLRKDGWDYLGSYHEGGYSLQFGAAPNLTLAFVFFSTNILRYTPVELNRFYRILVSKEVINVDGQNVGVMTLSPESSILNTADRFLLFARFNFNTQSVNFAYTRLKTVEALPLFNMVPALDPTGAPCMFDLVTRTPFYNSGRGAFIAGLETQQQLDAMLRKLPDRTGQDIGTLQVRLSDNLQTVENVAKLDSVLAKNWEIAQAV